MAYDYTAIPSTTALTDLLTAVGLASLASSVDADLLATYITAAGAALDRDCNRQFVPGSVGEVRYFNGSGTGTQIIDDAIDVTAVSFLVMPQSAGVNVTNWLLVEREGQPNNILQIYQGPANVVPYYWPSFPQGRSNIAVTGQFGYAAEIPHDVWTQMLRDAAGAVINDYSISGGARLAGWRDNDVSEDYMGGAVAGAVATVSDMAGWGKSRSAVVRRYSKPAAYSSIRPPLY